MTVRGVRHDAAVLAIALAACAFVACAPRPAAAQALWLDRTRPSAVMLESLHPDPAEGVIGLNQLEGFRGVLAWEPAAPALVVRSNGHVGLLPGLRRDPQSLVAAARFGIEVAEIWRVAAQNRAARTAAALRYMRRLPEARAPVLMASLPPPLAALLAEAEEDEDFDKDGQGAREGE